MPGSLRQDLAYAVRSFARTPGLTAVIVVSIGLGIAANTTVFGIVNGLLIRDMPVRDPARLFVVEPGGSPSASLPLYRTFRDETGAVFQELAAHSLLPMAANISAGGGAQRIWGLLVSGNYFAAAGVQPVLGRGILPSEDEVPGRDAVVVLSYGLWRRLGADPDITGRRIRLSGLPYTVVGVAPPGFSGTDRGIMAEFWVPLAMRGHLARDVAAMAERWSCRWLEITGRLRAGVSREQAAAASDVVYRRVAAEQFQETRPRPVTLYRVGLLPFLQRMLKPLMAVLFIVVGLLLLLACANVANLLLARAASRQHEIGVRLAVGAGRARIVRQLLTESVLIAAAGAALGFVLAVPGTSALARLRMPLGIPVAFDFSPDLRVLAFTTVLAVLTGILFGLAPALTGTRGSLAGVIHQTGRGGSGRNGRLTTALVGVQVALSVVLLVGSGLFLRSLQKTAAIDVGMEREGALMMAIDPIGQGYAPEKAQRFMLELQQRVEAVPGVQSMGYSELPPLSMARSNAEFSDADKADAPGIRGNVIRVGSHYFDAAGIRLLRGRDFEARRDEAASAAVINQAMAERLFGADDPIGRRIRHAKEEAYEVVGVVRNARSGELKEGEVPYLFRYYSKFDGMNLFGITLIVRAAGDPRRVVGDIRRQAEALDPDLPLFNVKTLAEQIDDAMVLPRISAALFAVFGAIGLVLAVVGLYGMVNYSVQTRTREIGIRMALGAPPAAVGRTILRRGLTLAAAGMAAGMAAAFALSRFTAGMLYGVPPSDPVTFVGVPAVLGAACMAALILPALRACRIDPAVALREE